jgi:hypothetical protein
MSESLSNAIDAVARQILTDGLARVDWEDFAEIGEHDWAACLSRARRIVQEPTAERFTNAYQLLVARAEQA